jgi:outer membrane autotransporter protein
LVGESYLNALNFYGTGTVALQADSTINTLRFTHSGNLQIASDATLTANITTSGTGTGSGGIGGVLFKGSGTLIGNAGNKTNHLAVLDMTAGNAQISGTIGADSIFLGLNTLSLVGNVGTDLTHSMITIKANNDNTYGKLVNTSPTALTTVDNTTAIVIDVGGYISTGASFKIISTEKNGRFPDIAPVTVHGSSNLVFVQDKTNTEDLVLIATRPEVSGGNVGGMLNLSNINPDGNLAEFLFYADQQQAPVASQLIKQLNNQLVTQSSVQAMHTVHQVANRPVHDRSTMIGANMQHDPQGVSAGEQFYPFEMSFLDGSEMWAKGFATIEKQQDKLGVAGYQNKITGAVLAIDGRYNQNVQLGIAGSYAISNIKINDGVSTVDMKNYQVTVYGLRHFDTNYYMTANVSMALNDYYGVRGIILPGISTQLAESKYKGNEYSADLSAGYPMKHKDWHIIPQASAYYRHINIDSYKETNAEDMNLTVHGQHYDFLGGRAGVVLSKVYKTHSRIQWIPEMRLDYQHDFLTQSQDSRSLFTGGGTSFETQGLAIYRNTVGLGLGVELLLPKRWAIGLDYHLTIKPSYSAESLVLTGKIPF